MRVTYHFLLVFNVLKRLNSGDINVYNMQMPFKVNAQCQYVGRINQRKLSCEKYCHNSCAAIWTCYLELCITQKIKLE